MIPVRTMRIITIVSILALIPLIGFAETGNRFSPQSALLGGIGTGKIEILADGRFGGITIQNNPHRPLNAPEGCFAAIAVTSASSSIAKGLYHDLLDPKSIENVTVGGIFPFAEVDYSDPGLPVTVNLKAFSPLILGNENGSSCPGVVFRYSVKNESQDEIQTAVALNWSNLIGLGGTGEGYSPEGEISHKTLKRGRLSGVHYRFKPAVTSEQGKTVHGEYALWYQSQGKEKTGYLPHWNPADSSGAFWESFQQDALFQKSTGKTVKQKVGIDTRPTAAVAARQTIPPGETRQFTFLLAWYMPHRITGDGKDWGNYYTNQWSSVLKVSDDLGKNWPKILKAMEAWQNSFIDSSLPRWLTHRLCGSMASLAENGIFLENGKFTLLTNQPEFLGNFGSPEERLVTLPFLLQCFPNLLESELNLYAACQLPAGEIPSAAGNLDSVIGTGDIPGGFAGRPDSSAAFILMVYEYYLWTGESKFLEELRPHLQAAMHWLESRDSNEDSIPDGPSLWPWSRKGNVSLFTADLWLAALRTREEVEHLFQDIEFQTSARLSRQQAVSSLSAPLWNGNFFNAFFDTERPDALKSAVQVPGTLPGEWFALFQGWNPLLKKGDFTRSLQTLSISILSDRPGRAKIPASEGGRLSSRYGFTSAFAASSLCRAGYPEAALNLVQSYHEKPPALAETGLWALYNALTGIGLDRQRRCLIVGPSIPIDSNGLTAPFITPHYAGTLRYRRSILTGQQQCELTFDRASRGKDYALEQAAFNLPLHRNSNDMMLTVWLNGKPLSGQDFSRESMRVFGFQPAFRPKPGDTLTLFLVPREGPRITLDLEGWKISNFGAKCRIEKITRSGQGLSFYVYNALRERQSIQLDITNPGERDYVVYFNGESIPLTIPTSEPVPVLLPEGHINRESYETIHQIQWACGEAAVRLASIPGKQELKKRLWAMKDDVNQLVERDVRQRGIRLDVLPVSVAEQTDFETFDPPEGIQDELDRAIQLSQDFLNDLDRLGQDPVLASEIAGLFVPITLRAGLGTIKKDARAFDLNVRLTSSGRIPVTGRISLALPDGWSSLTGDDVSFASQDGAVSEWVMRFAVTAPVDLWAQLYELDVLVSGTWNGRPFRRKQTVAVGHHFIRKWQIVGPFPNRRGEGFDRMYPPELDIRTSESYEGIDKKTVEWKACDFPDGPVDFNAVLPPAENAVAYAYVGVYSPREQSVQFKFGSAGDTKIFHNYKEIFAARNLRELELKPGSKTLYHKLYEGWNLLLVKLSRQTGPWGFYFEITSLQGLPLKNLQYALDRTE